MKPITRRRACAAALSMLAGLAALPAPAQEASNKTITLLVPYAAGGLTDQLARWATTWPPR
jgi:tripartite-type tricarboxylate transporter receptor subunit TctC